VALGAAATVLLATKFGFPVSTTHGIVGALVGAGLVGAAGDINFDKLGSTFFLPLVASPIMAMGLTAVFYPVLTRLRKSAGIIPASRVMTARPVRVPELVASGNDSMNITATAPLKVAEASGNTRELAIQQQYTTHYNGKFLGMRFQTLVDRLHLVSGGAVCFARSLNDTPKFLGLLLLCQFFGLKMNIFLLALVVIIGGLLHSKKVADTMSKKITRLNAGQGLTANLSTSFLVIIASRFGLPVSTTHVSVGSIFGIGLVNGTADKKQMKSIVASWVLTLPIAAFFSALFFLLFKTF
jgi:PiT family inorganic phosphate transporter